MEMISNTVEFLLLLALAAWLASPSLRTARARVRPHTEGSANGKGK